MNATRKKIKLFLSAPWTGGGRRDSNRIAFTPRHGGELAGRAWNDVHDLGLPRDFWIPPRARIRLVWWFLDVMDEAPPLGRDGSLDLAVIDGTG